VYYKLLVTK